MNSTAQGAATVRVASVKVRKMEPDRPWGPSKAHIKARVFFHGARTDEYKALEALLVTRTGRPRAVLPDGLYDAEKPEWVAYNEAVARDNRDWVRAYRELLAEALRQAGLPEDQAAVWNVRAGCHCRCSPGFVLGVTRGVNVFVAYEVVPAAE